MPPFQNIVIFHPAAIGDAMLATPVAKALKLNYDGSKISYWSHPALKEVLGCNPDIDQFLEFRKGTSLLELTGILRKLKPDLLIDLSNSSRGLWLSLTGGAKSLRYRKRPSAERPIVHAVDNFLATIAPVCARTPEAFFPTIFPNQSVWESLAGIWKESSTSERTFIGIVPGVGKLRPHRAWPLERWLSLIDEIGAGGKYHPVLIGGSDEMELCDQIAEPLGDRCTNLAGKLSLVETAACLKRCTMVISGDTGPAHLAVAVGTKVIGLYGPTFAARSGPYGCSSLTIDRSQQCRCADAKSCIVVPAGQASQCMSAITLNEVEEKMDAVFQNRGNMVS
jgi:ADP-heptose:LPS heptosyltransferase